MVAHPRLSVCITTRNRARYLKETLENILQQCTDDVEVVVVDGASTDDTVEVVRLLAARHPSLRLITPKKNSGLDADYDRAVMEARGEYCWLFSDDDLLADGAIARVLRACLDDPFAIVVDASVHTADFGGLVADRRLPQVGPSRYAQDAGEAFFCDCANHLSFIGCLTVSRARWISRERSRYYGTEFIHCGVLFQAPLPGSVIVIREPLVRIRHGLGNWLNRWFEVWGIKWPRLLWSFDWISESARASVQEREPWARFGYLIGARASRRYGWRQFSGVVLRETDRPGKLIAPLICVAMPWWGAYAAIATKIRIGRLVQFVRARLPFSAISS